MAIRILVVEDHTLVRQAIVNLLADDELLEVVGEASDGFDAVTKALELRPDVILMDLYMPGMDGIAATRLIKGELPSAQVILLTVSTEEDDVFQAVQAGARGYILKKADAPSLIQQIKQVISGKVALSEHMISKLLRRLVRNTQATLTPELQQPLTQRQKEVLELICVGMTNKEISAALFISENTVRIHVRNLMQKLDLYNRTQLAAYGARVGFGLNSKSNGTKNGSCRLIATKFP